MEKIDMEIIAACNELIVLKSKTTQQRVDNRNERARLYRELEQRRREVDKRFRSMRLTKDLSVYRDVCTQVFDEAGIAVPGLAAARQAQLCLHVHVMTVMDNQLDMLALQGQNEILAMEMELNRVREGMGEREIQLLNQIVCLQRQICELKEWIETTTPSTPPPPRTPKKKNRSSTGSAEEEAEEENQATPQQEQQQLDNDDDHHHDNEPSKQMNEDSPEQQPQQQQHRNRLERVGSMDSERTAQSTPPSWPESDSTTTAKETSNNKNKSERRGSLNLRGSFMMPARPRFLMSWSSSATKTKSNAEFSVQRPQDDDDHDQEDDDNDDDDDDEDGVKLLEPPSTNKSRDNACMPVILSM
ncbi:hypothetical protein ACA910_005755 [Epithemia clementina (nom. ined.)]